MKLTPIGSYGCLAVLLLAAIILFFSIVASKAQTAPSGQAVLNQARQGALLTFDQSFVTTRGIYIGDSAPCSLSVIFGNNNAPTLLPNLQSGMAYPFQIRTMNSSGSTCATVIGLW